MFRYAVKHDYVKDNPVIGAEIKYKKADTAVKPEEKYLDDDELEIILKYMYKRSPHYGRFCEFLYQTGLRFGEAAALCPSDIVSKDGKKVAVINSTLVFNKKQMSPKTANSNREVTLPDRAQELIKEEMESNARFKSEFIFSSPRPGYPMNDTNLNYWLRQCKAKNDIKKDISLHTFRHTHISKLAELGIPLYLIQHRVGHKDATTTKEIYLHVTKKAEQTLDSKLKYL